MWNFISADPFEHFEISVKSMVSFYGREDVQAFKEVGEQCMHAF